MKSIKGSIILAILGWLCVFFELAAILFKKIPVDAGNIFTFFFFFLIAVFASAVAQGSNKPKLKNGASMRIKIAGQIFTGDSLTIMELKSGDLFVEVDLSQPKKGVGQDEPNKTQKPVKVKRG